MIRAICQYFRQCKCKHKFEFIAEVEVHSDIGAVHHCRTYRCPKCGYVQRVRL